MSRIKGITVTLHTVEQTGSDPFGDPIYSETEVNVDNVIVAPASAAAGFVWSDLLTNLERVSDHCSNISGAVLDTVDLTMKIHENQRIFRESDEEYKQQFSMFQHKYKL